MAGVATPATAKPAATDAVTSSRPAEAVPKDKDGRLLLYVDGVPAAAKAAVRKLGGEVTTSTGNRMQVAVPADKIGELAKVPSVTQIRRPERAIPMAITSEGVAASNAHNWIAAGKKGAGVKVGIIDVGFTGLADAQAAGEVPQAATNLSGCRDATKFEPHGVAVAEVVHDMAPDAALALACIDGPLDLPAAEEWLRQQGVQVITAAIGFLTSGRGDGTGESDSPADVVRKSKQAGVLWSVAAGNLADHHFAGNAVDVNGDSWVEFSGTAQNNGFNARPHQKITVGLRWDAWARSTEDLDVYVMKAQRPPTGLTDPEIMAAGTTGQRDAAGKPTEEVTFSNGEDARPYWIYVKRHNVPDSRRLDLFVAGADSALQFTTPAGSVTEPATSPAVLAVGATRPNSGELGRGSGQGPTVDGRQKPDLVGFTEVSTSTLTAQGTSIAAAHVAGAAALLKSANPQLDAAQLESALLARTSPKRSDNLWGKGTLHLGQPTDIPTVTGSGYTPLAIPRQLQNRTYAPREVFTLPMPANIPNDTTAVVFNVAVRTAPESGPDVASGIDVFPENPAGSNSKATTIKVWPGSGYRDVMVVAKVGADRAVRLRAGAGHVVVEADMLGYFSPGSASAYFAKPVPQRVLDTRGPGKSPLGEGEVREIQAHGVAGVPSNATAVLVNITGLEATGHTALAAYARDYAGTTVNFAAADRLSNTSIVAIADDGKFRLRNAIGTTGALVDVVGWFAPGDGGRFVALPEPTRIVDTDTGTGGRTTAIGHGENAQFQVGGQAGIGSTASAAVLTVNAAEDSLGTEVSLSAFEAHRSPVTMMGLRQRETMAATTFSPLGASGKVLLRNERGRARVAVDAAGYFVGGPRVPDDGGSHCVQPLGEQGFNTAFDGRVESTLAGWQTAGSTGLVEQGCELATRPGTGVTWYSAHTYGGDYTVRFDWRATADNANSGVYVMFPSPGSDPAVPANRGLEVDLGISGAGDIKPGRPAQGSNNNPRGFWNQMDITVAWNTVTVWSNGQKVNEYTTNDPARLNANSFIGIQAGSDGEVNFRNVRIKRNTPVTTGQVKGVNNRCLDLWDGNPDDGRLTLRDCAPITGQLWTTAGDGTIITAGRCITVDRGLTAHGTSVLLWTCGAGETGAQQWVLRPDGTIVNPASNRCLTPVSGAHGAAIQIQDCTGRSEQVWRTSEQRGTIGALVNPAGKCVDVINGDPRSNNVHVWDCWRNAAQVWTAPGDGSLRAAGKCLLAHFGGTAAGTPVLLWDCGPNPGSGATWELRPDGTVLNPASGRCLTAASNNREARFTLQDCSSSALQNWRMSAQHLWGGQLVGFSAKCVDITDGNPATGRVWLWTCNYGELGQHWVATGDGTIQSKAHCLDISSTANASAIGVAGCTAGFRSQQWAPRPDGTIVNVQANRCVDNDSAGTANGNRIQIWDCLANGNQRWAVPVRAS